MDWKNEALRLAKETDLSWRKIAQRLGVAKSSVSDWLRSQLREPTEENKQAKILLFDVETSPLSGAVWSLWNNNVGLNQIERDWFILSYSAKWYGSDEIFYNDLRGCVKEEDDSKLLKEMWQLLDEADIVVAHNGKKFDCKKLNARFVLNGFQPPSSYKVVDTLLIAKSQFALTSNKLEYLTDKLCTKYKKQSHGKFAGYSLWKECLKDNPEAWEEMAVYNKYDVLSLEELYEVLRPWDKKHPNLNLYGSCEKHLCPCGSSDIIKYGFAYTQLSKFQRYRCRSCGSESRGRTNLLSKEQRVSIKMNVV